VVVSRPFSIESTAVADVPAITGGVVTGNEDGPMPVGSGISFAPIDRDASETISAVLIGPLPPGWSASFTNVGTALVTADGAGAYMISGPSGGDIRATLDAFGLVPPANADSDVIVAVTVTSRDANGSIASSSTNLTVVVNPVSDAPVLVATDLTVREDTTATFGNLITWTKPDNDGSERISRVELSGMPIAPGSAVTWVISGGAMVSNLGDGNFAITGASEADIRATLDTFAVRQAANSDADLVITARAQTTDGAATASTLNSTTLAVTVTAVADAPTVAIAGVSGNEDSAITFGNAVTTTKPDNDGSEWISSYEISAFPAGWAVAFTGNAAVTVTGSANGPYTLSIAAEAHEATLKAVLDSFRVTPPANSDTDANITVRAQSTDADGSAAWGATQPLTVVVRAVADMPSGTAAGATGSEDIDIPITLTAAVSGDADGSETLSLRITGVPTGATFSAGTLESPGVWTLTSAQLAGLTFRPPPEVSSTFNMVLEVTSAETATGLQVATASRTTTLPFSVVVNSVVVIAHAPVFQDWSDGARSDLTFSVARGRRI
jgi:hypothetical protein